MTTNLTQIPPSDSALGALDVALDGDAMADVLSRHLLPGRSVMRRCHPYYAKYKPERYCVVQYELTIDDQSTGERVMTPAHLTMRRPEQARKLWSRMRRNRLVEQAESIHPHLAASPATYVDELNAIAGLYPVDLKLPGLVQAAAPEICGRLHQVLGGETSARGAGEGGSCPL